MPDTYDAPLVVVDEKGRRFINREKIGENYFVLRMDNYPLTVAAAQQGSSGFSIPEDAGHAGDFEVAGIIGESTVPILVQLSEVGIEANAFMNAPVHHNLILGAGGLPFVLAETSFFIAGRFVQATITNLSSTTAAVVRIALVGRRFNHEMSPEVRERRAAFLSDRPTRPFWATLDTRSLVIAAGAVNQEAFITIPSGSHFVVDDILAESTRPFEVAIFDGQSGRNLTFGLGGGFVDSRLLTGTAQFPSKTIGSPIMQPRRSFRLLFNDLGNNGNNTIFFTLHGRRMRMPVG